MGILEVSAELGRLNRELRSYEKEKEELDWRVMETRSRVTSVEKELRGLEEELLWLVWREYWSKYERVRRLRYVSEEEKARLGYEELRERNELGYKRESKRKYKREYAGTPGGRLRKAYMRRASKCLGASPQRHQSESLGKLLGCSVKEWREHLERQFKRGMSWENYGKEWEVDHIMPISSFDLETIEGARRAFNWLNTKPMWASENNAKGSQITEPQYQLVLGAFG